MKYLIALFALATLSSCSTTGDPRSGGIFWSPRKAQERVDQLSRINDQAQYEKNKVEKKNRTLRTKKTKELNTY